MAALVVDSTIRRTLWSAFAALAVLALVGLTLTLTVLQLGKRQEYSIVHGSEPLNDAVDTMDEDTAKILSAARGFHITRNPQFQQQYDDAVREFQKANTSAMQLATDSRDVQHIGELRRHFEDIKALTMREMSLAQHQETLVGCLAQPVSKRHGPAFQVVGKPAQRLHLRVLHDIRGVQPRAQPGIETQFDKGTQLRRRGASRGVHRLIHGRTRHGLGCSLSLPASTWPRQ